MAISSKFRRVAAATAITALVGGGAVLTAGAAAAMPTEQGQCNTGDLDISVAERHSPNGGRLFEIGFKAKPGVSCEVNGAPGHLTFYKGDTVQGINTISPEPGTAQPYTIDEQHPGAAYVAAPADSSGPAPVSRITFNLPSGGADTAVSVGWPGPIDGPVRLGNIGPQVS